MKLVYSATFVLLVPAVCAGQALPVLAPAPRALSLEDVLRIAEERSEQVAIARSGVQRAGAQQTQARAERYPQLSASVSYDRTLASEFSGLFSSAPATGTDGSSTDFSKLPFGRKNIWRANLIFSQSLYTGGRVAAQETIARAGRENADIALDSARAQLVLDAVRAYYDAALSDQLVTIAEATYTQAEATFQQTKLQREAGTAPEFELLRAQVSRDTIRPAVLRQRSQRDLAYLRLKQLLEIPAAENVTLTTPVDEETLAPPVRFAPALATAETDALRRTRAPVRQAETVVAVREAGVKVARSERLPTLSVNSSYGRVNYPAGAFPDFTDFRTNWTVGAAAQIPILNGGRIKADEAIARADADAAKAQLQLTKELAELDTRSAFQDLETSRATWEASAGTVQQAQRAYEIAELRYRQGISTQLELSDSRLLLAQAQVNRAQAARDLQVARARVALLPNLPINTAGAGTMNAGATAGTGQPAQQQPQQQPPRQQAPAATGTVRAAQTGVGSIQQ